MRALVLCLLLTGCELMLRERPQIVEIHGEFRSDEHGCYYKVNRIITGSIKEAIGQVTED